MLSLVAESPLSHLCQDVPLPPQDRGRCHGARARGPLSWGAVGSVLTPSVLGSFGNGAPKHGLSVPASPPLPLTREKRGVRRGGSHRQTRLAISRATLALAEMSYWQNCSFRSDTSTAKGCCDCRGD